VKDPAPYLSSSGISVYCAVDTTMSAVLDAEHQEMVNWEMYFFGSEEHKALFESDPLTYCGWVTDPVRRTRFRPTQDSPTTVHEGRPFFFISEATRSMFLAHADSLSVPDYHMTTMK
jgi:YHS domain-containing protein